MLSLNIPLQKLLDDSESYSYGQLVIGSFITTWYPFTHHILCSVLATHQITQVTQPSYSPDLQLLAFPKTKITFEREEISDHQWYSGK